MLTHNHTTCTYTHTTHVRTPIYAPCFVREPVTTAKGRKVPRTGGASLIDDEAGDDSEGDDGGWLYCLCHT